MKFLAARSTRIAHASLIWGSYGNKADAIATKKRLEKDYVRVRIISKKGKRGMRHTVVSGDYDSPDRVRRK